MSLEKNPEMKNLTIFTAYQYKNVISFGQKCVFDVILLSTFTLR